MFHYLRFRVIRMTFGSYGMKRAADRTMYLLLHKVAQILLIRISFPYQ